MPPTHFAVTLSMYVVIPTVYRALLKSAVLENGHWIHTTKNKSSAFGKAILYLYIVDVQPHTYVHPSKRGTQRSFQQKGVLQHFEYLSTIAPVQNTRSYTLYYKICPGHGMSVYALTVSVAHLGFKSSPSCQTPPSCHSIWGEVTITGRARMQGQQGCLT